MFFLAVPRDAVVLGSPMDRSDLTNPQVTPRGTPRSPCLAKRFMGHEVFTHRHSLKAVVLEGRPKFGRGSQAEAVAPENELDLTLWIHPRGI